MLYRNIRVKNRKIALGLVSSTKPPEFFHNVVRHLTLESPTSCSLDEAVTLIRLCKGVVNFGCITLLSFADSPLLPILAEIRVERLAISLPFLFGGRVDLTHPLFHSITHLDIFPNSGVAPELTLLATLPALTHFSSHFDTPRGTLMVVLEECPRLQLLLVQWPSTMKSLYESARIPRVYDVRFVVRMYQDYWGDWAPDAKGVPHCWSDGDDFVERKRRGEIEGTVSYITYCYTRL